MTLCLQSSLSSISMEGSKISTQSFGDTCREEAFSSSALAPACLTLDCALQPRKAHLHQLGPGEKLLLDLSHSKAGASRPRSCKGGGGLFQTDLLPIC